MAKTTVEKLKMLLEFFKQTEMTYAFNKLKSIIGELEKSDGWQTVHQEFIDDEATPYLDKASAQDLINWLEENYNCPISKI